MSNGSKKKIFGSVGLAAVVLGLAGFVYEHLTYVTTDNAQVQGHALMISAKVGGWVNQVLVDENQKVTKGQLLAELDPRDLQNAFNQQQAVARSERARFRDAEVNFHRIEGLLKEQAVSRQQFDDAQAKFHELSERLKAAEAQLEQAQLNLSYTQIVAPADGSIARKSLEKGMLLSVGQPLFGFVSSESRWISANFKETELSDIKPGQKVKVHVDAIPEKTFRGEVESISSSTGSTFTLLPPDNATGNFTKVVQRVPVKIRLVEATPQDLERLQSGLSAVVSVKIR